MMMRFAALALLAAAPLSAGPASERSFVSIPAHIGGRVVRDSDGGLRFGWPATYFEARFRGGAVEAAVDSDADFLRLTLDGAEKMVLKAPGATRVRLDGLGSGPHVIRLEKQTESQSGASRFLGFFAPAGTGLPPKPRRRQIEFIGDSYTVGYGNASPRRECSAREVHDLTDTQRAFGPLLARRLDADYRVIAYSGFGIVRNYNGGRPGESLPGLYRRLLPGDPARLEAASGSWRPNVIVVNLGTNDFSTPLHAGEAWRTQQELSAAYRSAYIDFASGLAAAQPQARLVLMGSGQFLAEVEQVAAALNGRSPGKAVTLRFGGLELTGCNYHPSLNDHEALAKLVGATLESLPGLRW